MFKKERKKKKKINQGVDFLFHSLIMMHKILLVCPQMMKKLKDEHFPNLSLSFDFDFTFIYGFNFYFIILPFFTFIFIKFSFHFLSHLTLLKLRFYFNF